MRKKIALILVTMMTLGFTGCGEKADSTTENNQKVEQNQKEEQTQKEEVAKDAVEILSNVWGTYGEEEKFAAIGGDMEHPVDNAPGAFDISKAEDLDATLGFPQGNVSEIDDAASIMHMMNANTFTGATYHVTDAGNLDSLATAIKDNILARQWMCGFPDKLIVVQIGEDYLVTAFGNGEIMDNFLTKLQAQYSDAKILFEEAIR
ncbi:MAG: bacteriocin transport accessory protein [Lachnospiraceae bacterium]|nr:bacteriocin transport accessory protein [Lachnospiraceae bacterium]